MSSYDYWGEKVTDPIWRKLKNMGIRLRSMSYLIENQRVDNLPVDLVYRIRWGIGMILTDYSKQAQDLAELLEHEELLKAARRHNRKFARHKSRKHRRGKHSRK